MKKILATLAIVAGISSIDLAGQAPASVAPTKGIDAIAAYAGVWKVEMDHLAVDGAKASHENSTLRNTCWKSGGYFACNQNVDGESKVLIVFTFNDKENVYTSYQIPLGGGESGSGKLVIEGNTWTFPWQVTDAGKTTYYRVVNVFTAADRIEFRQEHSTDQTHWTVTAKGVETRTAAD